MLLPEKAIDEFQEIYKKTYGTEISRQEATESANRLIGLFKVLFDCSLRERQLKEKLKTSPNGFHIMNGGTYSCAICSAQIKNEELWYDKWGKKCLACQHAVNKKELPGSACRNNESWYSSSDLDIYLKLKAPTVKKLVRDGVLKARTVSKNGFMILTIKDNAGILPPKKLLKYVSVPLNESPNTIAMKPWYEVYNPKEILSKYLIWPYLKAFH